MRFDFQCPPIDVAARDAALSRQARLTKPPGSLGRLESLVVQMAAFQGRSLPTANPAACVLFAADHPVTRHGVSPYPSAVTRAMVANFVAQGAAASVLCEAMGVRLDVVDVGVEGEPLVAPAESVVNFRRDAVASLPVGDIRVEDAMSEAVFAGCLRAGQDAVAALPHELALFVPGEMGIGNTTVAACVCSALLGIEPSELVGAGTGASSEMMQTKVQVVRDALSRLSPEDTPLDVLRRVGGREIVAMFSAMAAALSRRAIVVVDGFIATSAALALCKLYPEVIEGMVFAHRSDERGHARVLSHLNATPLLDLELRLGEATGALNALPLIQNACALHRGMATFESASVPNRK